MDKRFFLALLLTMGVIVITPRLFPGPARQAVSSAVPPTTDSADIGTTPAPTTAGTAVAGTPATGAPTIGAAPTMTPPVAPAAEVRTLRLTSMTEDAEGVATPLATYDFSTRGAALVGADLPRYKRLGGGTGLVRLGDGGQPLVRYRLIAGGDTIRLDAMDFAVVEDTVGGRARLTFTAAVGSGIARIAYTITPNDYLAAVDVQVTGVSAPAFLLTDLPQGFDTQERDSVDDRRHLAYAMRTPAAPCVDRSRTGDLVRKGSVLDRREEQVLPRRAARARQSGIAARRAAGHRCGAREQGRCACAGDRDLADRARGGRVRALRGSA
jgi:hypothetical protein